MSNWTKELPSEQYAPDARRGGDYETQRAGKFARCEMDGVASIRAHRNYNGSGKQAFGGAERWPAVTIHLAFLEGAMNERESFVVAAQAFIDKWLEDHR